MMVSKPCRILLALLLFSSCFTPVANAAELDEVSRPLLQEKKFLYEAGFDYFVLNEDGNHGGAAYDKFYSTPFIYTLRNLIRIGLLKFMEVSVGFNGFLPV